MVVVDANRRIRPLHLGSGILIACFLVLHLSNHLAMFWGQELHIEVMGVLRPIYRQPFVEFLLMAALLFQLASGVVMIWRTRKQRKGTIGWIQAGSGILLLLFIANHVLVVWWGRLSLGLDTNYHFAAAGFHAGLAGFFIPYYFFGVAALFAHLACALRWRVKGLLGPALLAGTGMILAAGLVAVMAGDDDISPAYLDTYQ